MRGKISGLVVLLLAVLPILSLVQPAHAAGASYYFSPSTLKLNVGQSATVTLYVAAPDQTITAGDGTIVLPAQLTATAVSKSGSVFSLWPEEPSISGSTIRFAGGRPAPGFQGASGKILSFSVRGAAEGTGLVTLSGGRILYNDTNVYSGGGNVTATVTRTVAGAVISSSTHPDPNAWYKIRDAQVSWTKPSGATTFSYNLSHSGAETAKTGSGDATNVSFPGLVDGIWTLNLTTNFSDGKSATSSYTLKVDTTPPAAFSFTSERQNGAFDTQPLLKYQTTDVPSGVVRYEIIINDRAPLVTTETTYKLPVQSPGKYRLIVRAVDAAGNTTDATGSFTVEGFPGPVITSYPTIVSIFGKITLRGTALYGAKVQLYIDSTIVDEFIVKDFVTAEQMSKPEFAAVKDDTTVEWQFDLKNGQLPGYKTIYATQTKADGSESNKSNMIRILVAPDSVSLFGLIIPMFVILLICILLLGLLLLLIFFLRRKWKSRVGLRKESVQELKLRLDNEVLTTEGKVGQSIRPEEAPSIFDEINRLRAEINRDLDEALGGSDNKGDNKK